MASKFGPGPFGLLGPTIIVGSKDRLGLEIRSLRSFQSRNSGDSGVFDTRNLELSPGNILYVLSSPEPIIPKFFFGIRKP